MVEEDGSTSHVNENTVQNNATALALMVGIRVVSAGVNAFKLRLRWHAVPRQWIGMRFGDPAHRGFCRHPCLTFSLPASSVQCFLRPTWSLPKNSVIARDSNNRLKTIFAP